MNEEDKGKYFKNSKKIASKKNIPQNIEDMIETRARVTGKACEKVNELLSFLGERDKKLKLDTLIAVSHSLILNHTESIDEAIKIIDKLKETITNVDKVINT